MTPPLPELAADLTFVRLQHRSYGNRLHWDEPEPPAPGKFVMAVDGSDRLPGIVTAVRSDRVEVLDFTSLSADACGGSRPLDSPHCAA